MTNETIFAFGFKMTMNSCEYDRNTLLTILNISTIEYPPTPDGQTNVWTQRYIGADDEYFCCSDVTYQESVSSIAIYSIRPSMLTMKYIKI